MNTNTSSLPGGHDYLVEYFDGAPAVSVRAGVLLARGKSLYQRWDVWDTPEHGRLYRLDGRIMSAEKVEHLGHEPLVHIAGIAHGAPQRALVLGGGDGGSARQLLRYASMQEVRVAELDADVIELARRYLPGIHGGALDDPRVQIEIGDARLYVTRAHERRERFDLIVFDLTDPDTSAGPLHTVDFFWACEKLLSERGAVCVQLGATRFQPEQIARLLKRLKEVFTYVTPFVVDIPLYGGMWAMACASRVLEPSILSTLNIDQRLSQIQPLRALDTVRYQSCIARGIDLAC